VKHLKIHENEAFFKEFRANIHFSKKCKHPASSRKCKRPIIAGTLQAQAPRKHKRPTNAGTLQAQAPRRACGGGDASPQSARKKTPLPN